MNVNFSTTPDHEIDDIIHAVAGDMSVCVHQCVDIERACRRATGYLKRIGFTRSTWKGLTVSHRLPGPMRARAKSVIATRVTMQLGGWGGQLINVEKLRSLPTQDEELLIFVPEQMVYGRPLETLKKNYIVTQKVGKKAT